MRSLGEIVTDRKVVEKILRCLILEESEFFSVYTLIMFMGSLHSYDRRFSTAKNLSAEQALSLKFEIFLLKLTGRYESRFAGSGRGHGNGRGFTYSGQDRGDRDYACLYFKIDNHS